MSEVEIVTVSERGQIVLPKNVRERMQVSKGSKLLLVERGQKVTLVKAEVLLKDKFLSKGIETFIASEKSLKKDWGYKGDDVWNNL
ncbi:MAG: AbrB/MazE/SpoVT family DNA-binding domain-containing protein [archaeon]